MHRSLGVILRASSHVLCTKTVKCCRNLSIYIHLLHEPSKFILQIKPMDQDILPLDSVWHITQQLIMETNSSRFPISTKVKARVTWRNENDTIAVCCNARYSIIWSSLVNWFVLCIKVVTTFFEAHCTCTLYFGKSNQGKPVFLTRNWAISKTRHVRTA